MKKEVKLGILALVTIIFSILGYRYIKGQDVFSTTNYHVTNFSEVSELEIASPVMINGFKVGSVSDIQLNPENVNQIEVTYQVDKSISLPKSTMAYLKSSSIMGGRHVELSFDKICKENCLEDGMKIQGKSKGLIGSMISDEELDGYIDKLSGSMDTVMTKVTEANPDNPVGNSILNLEATMENMNKITSKLNVLLNSTEKNLSQTMSNLNSISGNLANNNAVINRLLTNVEGLSKELSSLELSNTISKSNTTLDSANDAMKEVNGLVSETKATVDELTTVIGKINEGDGSLSQLINDQNLYNNLNSTSENLAFLLQDLRLNPKRYLSVSVFGKKQKEYAVPENDPAMSKGN